MPRTATHPLAGGLLSGEVPPTAAAVTGRRERRAVVAEDHNSTVEGCLVCYGCRICRYARYREKVRHLLSSREGVNRLGLGQLTRRASVRVHSGKCGSTAHEGVPNLALTIGQCRGSSPCPRRLGRHRERGWSLRRCHMERCRYRNCRFSLEVNGPTIAPERPVQTRFLSDRIDSKSKLSVHTGGCGGGTLAEAVHTRM